MDREISVLVSDYKSFKYHMENNFRSNWIILGTNYNLSVIWSTVTFHNLNNIFLYFLSE